MQTRAVARFAGLVAAAGLCAASAAADVSRVLWIEVLSGPSIRPSSQRTFDLFAEVTPGTRIVAVDLGDSSINLAPAGVNAGLMVRGGSLRQNGAMFAINEVHPSAARFNADPLLWWDTFASLATLTDSQIGLIRPLRAATADGVEVVTGTWFDVPLDGVDAIGSNECGPTRIRLGRFTVDAAATHLGGDAGTTSTPRTSSIFVYWDDGVIDRGQVLLVPNAMQSACRGDFNGDTCSSIQDIFDFLAAYFAGSGSADVDDNGTVTVQDIFVFLAGFFTAC